MKILLINDYATPTGGAELALFSLRDGLKARGHDARVFSTTAGEPHHTRNADYECLGTLSRARTMLQTANPWAYWRLKGVLDEFQPDLVHVQVFLTQLSPLILPLLRRWPSLYHLAWYRAICPIGTKLLPDNTVCKKPAGAICLQSKCLSVVDWPLLMLQLGLFERWRDAFDLFVASSQSVKDQIVAAGIEPVEVAWYGVPERKMRPPLSATPTVVFAGRLVREKGVAVLLKAFTNVLPHVENARLIIAGDGPERSIIEESIDRLSLRNNVELLGHIPRQDVERQFDSAWVQVVPSLWAEPFGLVAAEAMMRGTAVIASDTGGPTETVQHQRSGLLVETGNVEALTEALLSILTNRERAESMGRSGREFALSHLSDSSFVDRFLELYQTVVKNRSTAGRLLIPAPVNPDKSSRVNRV